MLLQQVRGGKERDFYFAGETDVSRCRLSLRVGPGVRIGNFEPAAFPSAWGSRSRSQRLPMSSSSVIASVVTVGSAIVRAARPRFETTVVAGPDFTTHALLLAWAKVVVVKEKG